MDALISPRRRTLLQAIGAAAVVAGCGDYRAVTGAPAHEFRGPTMGGSYTLKIADPRASAASAAAARDAADAALEAVEAAMSAFRADSELSRFNAHASSAPYALSGETFAVFALAREVSAATDGAFDITVAPAVDAWGFGPDGNRRVPAAEDIAPLAPRIGWPMLALDADARAVAKARPDLRADLSGIAKGFGVDQAARALDAMGVTEYMIEAGGEVRTRGRNAAREPWQIGIERPDAVPPRAHFVVPLSGQSIATSGDYRIWFERDGRRYCHEIDPRTRMPIPPGLASVSVVAPECGYADAMATALMVLGTDEGFAFAQANGIAAHFIVRTAGAGFRDLATDAFARLGGRSAA
jgi:thiamine biosynthesis lipoprotein